MANPDRRSVAFTADVQAATIRGVRLAGGVGAVFVPLFYFLDMLLVPQLASLFLEWRLGSSLVCIACVLATYRESGRTHIVAIGYLECLAVSMPIAAMVYRIDPGVSTYYAGLNLCLLAIAVLFPWRPIHTVMVSAIIMLEFVLPVVSGSVSNAPAFVNNLFFLATTAAIGGLSALAHFQERKQRFDLSWSLEQRSRDLASANDRLRQVDELKNRFFANISHELRTPLTLAISPLEALLSNPEVPDSLRPTLRALHLDMLALGRRIEDLVDLARLDSRRLELSRIPVDLGVLTEQVVTAAQPYADRHGLTLAIVIDRGVIVRGDARVLEQVLFNLLSNALKFTPSGGRVTVRVLPDSVGRAVVSVQDTGPGIGEEEQAQLFERFGRSTETTVARGSGLGLALVKEFVELHEGTVQVQSAVGHGATFSVYLPTTPEAPTDAPLRGRRRQLMLEFETGLPRNEVTVRPSSSPDDRHLVLVVDDNRRLRQFVAQSLAAEFRVAEAEDGREALALLERETPAVVVSDVMMPGIDGRALLAAIRSDPRLKTLPVVLLTAHGDADARNDALESGASDYLSKPFSVRELRARVRNLDALRSAQVELSATADALRHSLAETQTAQGRALRAEKLAAIGQVASGIAHEVKNPINFVLNFARPSRARLERIATQLARSADSAALVRDVAAVQEALGRVVEGAERVVGIVDGLQAFARGGGARVQVDVDAEVMAVARLAGPSVREGVKLETTLGAVGTVLGSPVGVGAVLMNLLTNALYAVGAQGCVRILTHATASHVTIEVIDDGPGVPEHLRARIFDPFFTTRTAGEGLGLGLALVQRIIHDDLGGTIEVMDAADGGARFRVCLPRRGTAGETGWVDVAP